MSSDPLKDPARSAGRRRRRKDGLDVDRRFEAKTLVALAVGVLIIAFAVANNHDVKVDFLVTTANTPLVIVIVIAMLLGFVLGNLMRRRTHRASKTPKAPKA
jgi:uncharacterized integral membrane protein